MKKYRNSPLSKSLSAFRLQPSAEPFRAPRSSMRAELGASMVEFAMTVAVFMMFIVLGIDIIVFGYVSVTVQHVLSRAARDAIIGTTDPTQPNVVRPPDLRAGDIVQDIYRIGDSFGLDLRNSTITICPLGANPGAPPSCSPNDAGTRRDYIKIRLVRPHYFMWTSFGYNIDRSVVAKNEPF